MNENNRKIFDEVYEKNKWKVFDSRSGVGSDFKYTAEIRERLPLIISHYGIKSIVDCGCGDLHWMSRIIDDMGIEYHGVDIADVIVKENKAKYPGYHFYNLDVTEDRLPACDMAVIKDVFIHLSLEDIVKALDNIRQIGIRYLLASTYRNEKENIDKPTNHYARGINLEIAPFNMPEPILRIWERYDRQPQYYQSRFICLWDLQNGDNDENA